MSEFEKITSAPSGKVIEVVKNELGTYVWISIGGLDGVRHNQTYKIYTEIKRRDLYSGEEETEQIYAGMIKIVYVEARSALGEIIDQIEEEIKPGMIVKHNSGEYPREVKKPFRPALEFLLTKIEKRGKNRIVVYAGERDGIDISNRRYCFGIYSPVLAMKSPVTDFSVPIKMDFNR